MAKKRKRGDGSLHLRKDGRWEGRYVVGHDEKGRPKTKNVLAKTKGECAAKLKALKESLKGLELERPMGRSDLRNMDGPLVSDVLQTGHQAQDPGGL